jgi:hypothetical protein
MKPRRRTVKICFPVIFLSLLAVSSVQASEPYYNGKPLSDWLSAPDDEEQKALEQMGTNAIPTLMDILGATPRTIKRVVARLASKEMREAIRNDDGEVAFGRIKENVVHAFGILGTNAESVVPQMVKLLNKDNDDISPFAADALAQVGPKGFTALTNVLLTAPNPSIRVHAIVGISLHGDSSKLGTQIFLDLLKDKDADVRGAAANQLTGRDPDVVIPALMPMLDDPNPTVCQYVAGTLGTYGAKAKSTAPKITSLYTNTICSGKPISDYGPIFEALKSIDMKTAEEAEAMVLNSGPLNPKRDSYSKTELKNGKILVVGGWVRTELVPPKNRYLSSAEIYDPKTGEWTETGEMSTPRFGHGAVLLSNGKVLVVGGESGKYNGTLSSAEIYDPATGKWTPTTSMHSTHFGCKAKLNPDGTVLVFRELYNNVPPPDKIIEKCEQYDPATATWTVITNK